MCIFLGCFVIPLLFHFSLFCYSVFVSFTAVPVFRFYSVFRCSVIHAFSNDAQKVTLFSLLIHADFCSDSQRNNNLEISTLRISS